MFDRSRTVLVATALAAAAGLAMSPAQAQDAPPQILVPENAKPGAEVLVTLSSGETLRCTVEEVKSDVIVLKHPVLGTIEAPRVQVTGVRVEKEAPPPPPPPPPPTFFEGWTGSLEAGASGSEGNTENMTLRSGVGLERLTPEMETRFNAFYTFATDEGEKSKSRGEVSLRNDWLFKDSPWGFFAKGTAEYDEFQDWRWRLSGFAGPSYTVIQNDDTLLRFRAGAGVTRELGGSDNDLKPEALLGVDFSHAFTKHQKFFVTSDLLPSLDDFGEFRWNTKAGYEIMIDPEARLSLRLGIDNRYDSDPGPGSENNDLDYFALLAWAF